MEVSGKLIKKLDLEKGVSSKGKEWQKQTAIIDTGSDFNNIVAISCFGDKVERMNKLGVGDNVIISCNVYSREYNGKYYHNIDGYWFAREGERTKEEFVTSDDNDLPF